ncbi:MAG: response regulator, partial [Acidobacteria bacterium]|nr:response regulator [Acidobacteriota bacterium]
LAPLAGQLGNIAEIAAPLGYASLAEQAERCKVTLSAATTADKAYLALDAIAVVEAELLSIGLPEEIADVVGSIDESFDEILQHDAPPAPDAAPAFSIDQETLDVFRNEGEELLAGISLGIDVLAASPSDQNALWDIRRAAHTFKGAAGIVGLNEAASIAHRMEDLLDRLVESNGTASQAVTDFLRGCVRSLGAVLDGHPANAAGLELIYQTATCSLDSKLDITETPPLREQTATSTPAEHKPVVRISIDRISEIVRLAEELLHNRKALDAQTSALDERARVGLQRLIADGSELAAEIHDKLVRVRLVRFGMLETRLSRAVNVTATEENKKVLLEIETPDVEIDTLILDALVEPLLHLIKNAVVHGVELPDVRRMVGKHEFGLVTIRVEADSEAIVVTVADDGAGIALDKVRARAVERKILPAGDVASLPDRDAYKLLFDKGLTTAENVTLNAGRGIGMGIVKEAIESRGGSVHIESTSQLGTSFTLMLPTDVGSTSDLRPNVNKMPQEGLADSALDANVPLILVVDDSATIRRATQQIVEDAELRCITAEHGADALELLLNGSVVPDLILSDVEMPHMDGWQLLEYIKTDDNLGHVPVVMVTSLDGDDYRAMAANLGAADYVIKPFGAADIARVLDLVDVPAVVA